MVLDLRMYLGAKSPHDSVLIDGVPLVDVTIKGGVHGDRATPAIVANVLPKIEGLEPGLRTMIDLPPFAPSLKLNGEDRAVTMKTF